MSNVPRPRALWASLLALAAFAAVGAGLAWACTPTAQFGVSPLVAAPGQPVTLTGSSFAPDDTIRITWQGTGQTATARADNGGNFAVNLTVPAGAANGPTTLVAVGASTPQYPRATAFTVGAPPAPQSPSTGSGGGSGSQSGSGSGATAQAGAGAGAGEQPAATEQAASTGSQRASKSPSVSKPSSTTARRAAPSARRRAPATARRGAPAAPSGLNATVETATGQTAFAGSVAAANPTVAQAPRSSRRSARSGAGAPTGSAGARQPSEAAAGGNVWEGFSSGSARPGLSDMSVPAESPSSVLTVGMVLLGLGLVAVFGAVAVTELRRRRAIVGSDERRSD